MTRRPFLYGLAVVAGVSTLSSAAKAERPDLRDYVEPYLDEPYQTSTSGMPGADIVLEIGFGGTVQNRFEGSDEYVISPMPIIAIEYFSLPNGWTFGGPKDQSSISFRPDFKFRGERDGDDVAVGIPDVDKAYEVGGAVAARFGAIEAEVAVRYGFGGHNGVVGEATVRAHFQPTDRWTFSFGPQVTFATEDYMDTYFEVTAAQSVASGLKAFDPEGGIKSVGVVAKTRIRLTNEWSLLGNASYHKLAFDAADSPIVKTGDREQFTFGAGLSYRFGLDLF
ncbi:MAG: MipA/OmpV family protein [Pseudomonadota bacterium]